MHGSNKEKGEAMRALVYQGPWQMPLQEVVAPVAGPGELVISVQAAGICGSDIHGYKGTTGRRKPPIIMGHEFSGVVSQVGEGVTRFRVGDRVVAQPLVSCGECYNCRKGLANICMNRCLRVHKSFQSCVEKQTMSRPVISPESTSRAREQS